MVSVSRRHEAAPAKLGMRSGLTAQAVTFAVFTVALCLLPALAYLRQQMRLPAAGAFIIPNSEEVWQPDGIIIQTPRNGESQQGGVLNGDVMLAIDGRPLSEWGPQIALGRSDPQWQIGQVLPVTVRRDGREMAVAVELRSYPILAVLSTTWSVVLFASFTFLVGSFVLWRRPQLAASRVIFLWGSALLGSMTWSLGLDVVQMTTSLVFWLYTATACVVYLLFWTSGLHLALIFPAPHPWLKRRQALVWLVHPLAAGAAGLIALSRIWRGEPLAWIQTWLRSAGVVALPTGVLMILVMIWGYRRYYDEDSRRRARIFLFTAIICGGTGIVLWLLPPLISGRPLISANFAGLLLIPAPVSMAIAIVRHRLFDIDVIIRRTLIYTLLTGILALIYFVSVVVLQSLLGAFSGRLPNLAIVLSTLGIATLFSPMRRWIQTAIDRRFYRKKYDARATVDKFAVVSRNQVDLNTISDELVALIQQTVQPAHLSLWLADPTLPSQFHPEQKVNGYLVDR